MFKYLVCLVLISVALPSFAGEISPGNAAWAHCSKNEDTLGDTRICIADVAGEAMAKLKQKYQQAQLKAHQQDVSLEPPWNVIESKLVISQNAFLNYMEKQCAEDGLVGAKYTTGTGVGEGTSKCEIDLIRQRITILDTEY